MTQTKRGSLIESVLNAALGYGIAVVSQLLIFPLFGIHIPFHDNLLIGVYFTGISLVRSYVIRRWFNGKLHAVAERLASGPPCAHHWVQERREQSRCTKCGAAYGRDGLPLFAVRK